jgi:Mg2+ and Co2+ transporter CorA
MVNEVETILNEIRDRVRVEEDARAPVGLVTQPEKATAVGVESQIRSQPTEALARASAHLTTTARAWDRLPPIFSNRGGSMARIELWIKAKLRSLTRWFTWEQVNFNAAVHHALTDTLETLAAHRQQLIAIQNQLAEIDRELQTVRINLEAEMRRQDAARAADLESHSSAMLDHLRQASEATAQVSNMLSDLANETRGGFSDLAGEVNTRLAEMADDLREEQRVCFKQLSLEASEAALLEDRGRRALESRLEKLEKSRDS